MNFVDKDGTTKMYVAVHPGGLEPVEHFFLHCQFHANQRMVVIDNVSKVIGNEVQVYPEQHLWCIFLYGS